MAARARREKILDPRFAGLQYEIQALGSAMKQLYDLLNPKQSVLDVYTISKAAAFTDTDVDCMGSNLIQISTDGNLANVSYKIVHLDGGKGQTMEAAESPHIIGPVRGVLVTNDYAESGKNVRVARYRVSPLALPAILHGTPSAATVKLSRRPLYAEKLEYAAGVNYFETDENISTVASLSFDNLTPTDAEAIQINTILWQIIPANAVTYEMFLCNTSVSGAGADQIEADVFFSSGSGLTSGTPYIQVPGGSTSRLPVQAVLSVIGEMRYKIDWSAAPGAGTTGYIKVYGEVIE